VGFDHCIYPEAYHVNFDQKYHIGEKFGSSVKSVGKSSSHSLPGQSGNLAKDQKLNLNR